MESKRQQDQERKPKMIKKEFILENENTTQRLRPMPETEISPSQYRECLENGLESYSST